MIYNQSTDPIILKKVYIRTWSLKDQIKALIKRHMEIGGKTDKDSIKEMYEQYLERSVAFKHFNIDKAALYINDVPEESSSSTEELPEDLINEISTDEEITEEEETVGNDDIEAMLAGGGDDGGGDDDGENSEDNEDSSSELIDQDDLEQLVQSAEEEISKDKFGRVYTLPKENVYTTIPTEECLSHGSAYLSEVFMEKMLFFTDSYFRIGQSILIEFLVPDRFIVTAEVVNCFDYNLGSRVIAQNRPRCRIHAKFIFLRSGERLLLRKLVESIHHKNSEEVKESSDAPAGDIDVDEEIEGFEDLI